MRRDAPVPGVKRMPGGFGGDLGAGPLSAAGLADPGVTEAVLSRGAGVPKRACLNARMAKMGAGVSG